MNNSDLILRLVEKLLAEKEKNIRLQQEKQQLMQNITRVKTNM